MSSPQPATPHGRRFADLVAVITGASRGIGLAVAERIVAEGGQVCITARKPEGLTSAVDRLGPDRALGVAGRADDSEHQEAALRATLERFGRVDVLVNNTGINPIFGPLSEVSAEVAAKIMEVNVRAALDWVQAALRGGLGAAGTPGGGAVVNIASIAGLGPAPGIAYYGVSKAALIGLTVQLAAELAPQVRVNAVAPAVIKTRFAEALYSSDEAAVAAGYPLKRLGEPQDVAALVAFLASADAAWITGQVIRVDGGIGLTASL